MKSLERQRQHRLLISHMNRSNRVQLIFFKFSMNSEAVAKDLNFVKQSSQEKNNTKICGKSVRRSRVHLNSIVFKKLFGYLPGAIFTFNIIKIRSNFFSIFLSFYDWSAIQKETSKAKTIMPTQTNTNRKPTDRPEQSIWYVGQL